MLPSLLRLHNPCRKNRIRSRRCRRTWFSSFYIVPREIHQPQSEPSQNHHRHDWRLQPHEHNWEEQHLWDSSVHPQSHSTLNTKILHSQSRLRALSNHPGPVQVLQSQPARLQRPKGLYACVHHNVRH